MDRNYKTNPKEVYTLELYKLQRCFSELTKVGEGVSELPRVGWKQVEYLRHLNFILQEATMIGETLLEIAP